MAVTSLEGLDVPLLPPLHFYRVVQEAFGMMEMQIRKSNKHFGSRYIAGVHFFPVDYDTAEESLRMAAYRAVQEWETRRKNSEIYKDAASFVGDHRVSCTSH